MEEEEIKKIDWSAIDTEGEKGYILMVDLSYPSELHEKHCSFPLCPERVTIDGDMLSDYAKKCRHILDGRERYSAEKLTATFRERRSYVVHYAALKTYLRMGMKLEKVEKVLKFTQSRFLKQYVDKCTMERKKSSSRFYTSIFKFLCNVIYGKSVQQVDNYIDCSIVSSRDYARKLIAKPMFTNFRILNSNCVVIFSERRKIYQSKPNYLGFSILDFSKSFMYKSYYDTICKKIDGAYVVFSDTDSFAIECDKGSEGSALDKLDGLMDYSNYPEDHAKWSRNRKNMLGYFKDELKGEKMTEFCGLRSKTYAFLHTESTGEDKNRIKMVSKAKGVTRSYKRRIAFADYKKCIEDVSEHIVEQYHLRARSHKMSLVRVKKIAFSSFDDKRWLTCSKHSVPYGSCLIEKGFCPYC